MGESFDPATSSLLCLENNNACFDDFECSAAYGSGISPPLDHKILNFNDQSLSWDNHGSEPPFMGFLVQSDEIFRLMIERENEHLPRGDYLMRLRSGDMELNVVRKEAIDWIWKAHAYYGFGPSSFCLSVNYLDRFLSVYESPINKSWAVQLLAVACFSIAAKMEETKVPHIVELQVEEPKFVYEAITIQRMELLVLSTLKWKMQTLNPCSFIDYYLSKITCDHEQHPAQSSISRSVELILSIIKCVDFLEFRPSEIAAAVAVSVSMETQSKELDKALNCVTIVEKERVLKCLDLIKDLSLIKVSANSLSNSAPSVPQSPVAVLDATCLSYKSDELTVGSFTDSSPYRRNAKRRRTDNGPSDGNWKS